MAAGDSSASVDPPRTTQFGPAPPAPLSSTGPASRASRGYPETIVRLPRNRAGGYPRGVALSDGWRAGLAMGGVLAALAAGSALVGHVRRLELRRARNPWITLKRRRADGRRQRVLIDDDGRIELGLPDEMIGAHIGDLTELTGEIRKIEREGAEAETRLATGRAPQTFQHEAGVKALLEANPKLVDFLEAECSHDCLEYRTWLKRGRRGRKPQWRPGDGRFDAVNERHERKGARKVASWLEAVYTTPPPSRRWEDFPERVAVLEEATGLRLELPTPAEQLERRGGDVGAVRQRTDERIAAIVGLARTGRLRTTQKMGGARSMGRAPTLAKLERDLARAQAASDRAMEVRRQLTPGKTGRKRLASASAKWAIKAEARDRILGELEAARAAGGGAELEEAPF